MTVSDEIPYHTGVLVTQLQLILFGCFFHISTVLSDMIRH